MLWIHHQKALISPDADSNVTGRAVASRLEALKGVTRLVIEGHLGTDGVPQVDEGNVAGYYRARFQGHPILVMTTAPKDRPDIDIDASPTVDVWFSPEAQGAWRYYVEGNSSTPPPRRRARVHPTADDAVPYMILGAKIRRWNASQDLPKLLVGATPSDPDGVAFLGRLGRRWRRIAQALVAEMVKDALRPVPETTEGQHYATSPLGDGSMIRFGKGGPIWVDALGAVHLAELAGYPLGYPREIPHDPEDNRWTLLREATTSQAIIDEVTACMVPADDIWYEMFAAEIGTEKLRALYPEYRWGRGGPAGERMKEDAKATYTRGLYKGHPVLKAHATGRTEIWLSVPALTTLEQKTQADSIPAPVIDTIIEAADPDSAPRIRPFRKRHHKAVARLGRAIARLDDAGLVLVMDKGTLKACRKDVDPNEVEKDGLLKVGTESAAIKTLD